MPRLAPALTKAAIAAMARNSELADHAVPGLRIWRGARNRGWSLIYSAPSGKRRRLNLGSPDTGTDLEAARDAAREALVLLARGVDPRNPPKHLTVADALDRYEREYLEHRRTGLEIGRLLRKEVSGRFGALPVAALHRRHLVDLHTEMRAHAPACANRTLGYVHTMLAWAVVVGLIDANPAAGLKRHVSAKERPRSRVLADSELKQLWAASHARDGFPGWYGALVRLTVLTGQRRGEIAALRPEWIDDRGWATVPAELYKTERSHRFFLTGQALKQLPKANGAGRFFPADPPWSRYKLALERAAGFDGWTLHDLRRTFATGLRRLGEQRDLVELCLGHAVQGMVRVYQVYDFELEKRGAWERWSDHVAELVTTCRS